MYARRDYSVFIMPPPPAAKSGGGAHAYRKIQSWWPGTALSLESSPRGSLESSPRSLSVMHAPCPGRYDMHMHTAEHAAATFQPSTSNPAAQPTCQHAIMPTSCHHHRAPYTRPRQDGNARRAHTKKANKQSAASQNALQSDKDHSGASPSNGEHSPCGLTADALKACGRLHWGRRRAGSRSACDLSSGVACRPFSPPEATSARSGKLSSVVTPYLTTYVNSYTSARKITWANYSPPCSRRMSERRAATTFLR